MRSSTALIVTSQEECISEDEKKIPYSYVIYERKGKGK